MTNKPDISPYVYFEDMEEGVEYISFFLDGGVGVSGYTRRGNDLLWRHGSVADKAKQNLVFIPRYTPPKPANSWDEYMTRSGWFHAGGDRFIADSDGIDYLADDPKAHAAFNDLIESKRNKGG